MKTLIAIPSMDQVPAQFAQSLAMLRKVDQCAVSFNVGSLVYSSRNELARRAVEMGADYIFWLDSDMVFEPDTLERMFTTLREQEGTYDIITGVYFRRVAPYSPVLYEGLKIDENGACTWKELTEIPDGVFEVEGCGFGCVLLPVDAILSVQAKFGTLFWPIGGTGEDLSFCWRVRECGYRIGCDPRIPLGHVGNQIINRRFYESFKEVRNRD